MKQRFTKLLAAVALLVFMMPSMAGWGQTRVTDPGTFIIDFYDEDKLTSTSGTGLTNDNYSSFVQVPTGANVVDVVTSVSVTGTVQYGKNGGLTAGTGTAGSADSHYVTFNIGSGYEVTKCTVYATKYEDGRWLLNGNAAGSGSLGAKGAKIETITTPLIWDNLDGVTALTFKKDNGNGGNQKRLTIYRIICEYSTGTAIDPTITFNDGSVKVGRTLDLNTLFTSNSTGAVTYSIIEGNSCATLDGSILTGVAAGSVAVLASQAAAGSYQAGEATASISVTNPTLSSIAITTPPMKTTYTEGETFDATGMVVTATYSDASTENVTASCTWTPNGALTTSNTEITVSYTENNVTKTATQAITVSEYEQPIEFDIYLNDSFFGTNYGGNAAGITDENPESGTQDNVTITYAGSGNHYINSNQIRFYPNNKLTFEAPSGYVIKSIAFTSAGTWAATISANVGTYNSSSKTWTGSATSILFTGSGSSRCDMSKVTITLDVPAPEYNITYATGLTNGAFAAGNPTSANAEATVSVNTEPAQNYRLATMTYSYTDNNELINANATINGNAGSFEMPAANVTVSATFELIPAVTAIFTDGVYSETLLSQASFDNWNAYSVSGDQVWGFASGFGAKMSGYENSTNKSNEDWLISPTMAVANGKLDIAFECAARFGQEGMITLWYSNDYPGTGDPTNSDYHWTQLTPDQALPYANSDWSYQDATVTINDADMTNIHFALKYVSTTENAGTFEMKNFIAKQYYTITVADTEHGTVLAEPDDIAVVGSTVTVVAGADEGYQFVSWDITPSTVTVEDDQFMMPASNVTLSATFAETVMVSYNYSINGVLGTPAQAAQGSAITLASGDNINNDYVFIGWTINSNDVENILPAGSSFTVNENVVFYAVYGKQSTTTASMTIDKDTQNFPTSYGTANTFSEYTLNGKKFKIQQVYINGSKLQFRASGNNSGTGTIYNNEDFGTISSIVLNYNESDSNKNFTVIAGSAANPTGGTNIIPTFEEDGKEYTFDMSNGNYTYFVLTNGTGAGYLDNIIINYTVSVVSACYTYVDIKTINAYTSDGSGEEPANGWYLIASPVASAIAPSADNGFITEHYDLYRFNQNPSGTTVNNNTEYLEWENYKVHHFNIESGRGYLYASSTNTNLVFAGTPYSGDGQVTLHKTTDAEYSGWNLVGNPFASNAEVNKAFYKMNSTSDGINVNPYNANSIIAPMEGVFVLAAQDQEKVTFTATTDPVTNLSNRSMSIDVNRNGEMLDRAIVSFNAEGSLSKLVLSDNTTKLYFRQGQKDYAIVASDNENEMPVSFKASRNGTYTLNIITENVEMNYLHLIDNMTGMDVDLLQTPSYTFDATTNDYASRFRLVFSANNVDGPSTGSETFAFFSNGNWVVNNEGEATLQVIDVNGRIVSNETINGTVATSINATPGVYMLRLVNGNEVKTQKIVVR